MKLKDKVVFITGSTLHTGYGIAQHCLQEGALVVLNGIKHEEVATAADQLRKETNGKIIEAHGDISKENDVIRIFGTIEREAGKLDILILNACHLGVGPNFIDLSLQLWDDVIGVNVRGMFLCGQQAARMMRDNGGGTIVTVGSVQGLRGSRNRSAYIASKGAVESCTRAMALDLAAFNIRVNMVVPGYIHTSRWDDLKPEAIDIRRGNLPLGKEVEYEDIAKAILFLSTSDSRNITGASIVVDGGLSMQLLPSQRDV